MDRERERTKRTRGTMAGEAGKQCWGGLGRCSAVAARLPRAVHPFRGGRSVDKAALAVRSVAHASRRQWCHRCHGVRSAAPDYAGAPSSHRGLAQTGLLPLGAELIVSVGTESTKVAVGPYRYRRRVSRRLVCLSRPESRHAAGRHNRRSVAAGCRVGIPPGQPPLAGQIADVAPSRSAR